jgi:protocatechuate 3,4-dioxygenase beta subunit
MFRSAFLILLALLVAGISVMPQGTINGSIEGIVVKIGTNDPISGVNLEMRRMEGTPSSPLGPLVYPSGYFSPGAIVAANSPNPGDVFFAKTQSDGRFVFRNLKPGKYRLLADYPFGTYYPAEYGQRHPRGPGYNFSVEDAPLTRIRVEMAPYASVSGRIIDADGKPAARVRVMAAEVVYEDPGRRRLGERSLNLLQAIQTDERGNYRLFWLPPGQYYIGALPEGLRRRNYSMAYGAPGRVAYLNQTFTQAFIQYRTGAAGEVVEETYETVYHPGDTNLQSAQLLTLRPGTELQGIDISLVAGRHPALRIRGVVIDDQGLPAATTAGVRAVPKVSGPANVAPTATTDSNGRFEITGVTRGEYTLVAENTVGRLNHYAVQVVNVGDSNIEGVRLLPKLGLAVPVRIMLDGRTVEGYSVSLTPESRALQASTGPPLINVSPGSYTVALNSPAASPDAYIRSIRFGGLEAADGRIQITESSVGDLEIDLASRSAVIEGRVLDAQRAPSVNVMVVVTPVGSLRSDLFKTTMTDLNGNFRISGLAPGNYRVFAWPYIPRGMWQNPEFLRTVESLGKPLVLTEGSRVGSELTLLPEVTP